MSPTPTPDRLPRPRGIAVLTVLLLSMHVATTTHAEDADRFRPYMQWRSYEWDTIWDVHDAHGLSFGANIDRHLGLELSLDTFQLNLRNLEGRSVAEQSSVSLTPLIRFRWPLLQDRLVPYAIAGVGASFMQFNDRKPQGFGIDIEAEAWEPAVTLGGGIEYFLTDEIAFGFEAKYQWIDDLHTRFDGQADTFDMSSFLLSFGLRLYFDENLKREFADAPGDPRPERFYFGVRAGVRSMIDDDWGNGVKLIPLAQSREQNILKHFGVTMGANLVRQWAVEIAVDGGETGIEVDGQHAIGEYAQVAIMPQIRYRWPVGRGRWVPYASAGGGLMFTEYNDAKPDSVLYPGLGAEGLYPVFRVGGGVEYFFTRNFSLGFETNYQYTWDHELLLPDRGIVKGDFSSFQALVMFRAYLFNL